MKENPELFDTSNYPTDNPFGIAPQNKGVLGLFKDELVGSPMTFLRPSDLNIIIWNTSIKIYA
jgi:hypothetical protein